MEQTSAAVVVAPISDGLPVAGAHAAAPAPRFEPAPLLTPPTAPPPTRPTSSLLGSLAARPPVPALAPVQPATPYPAAPAPAPADEAEPVAEDETVSLFRAMPHASSS